MAEFLRDPIWQFVGAVLGLIAIAISIYLAVLQRRQKTISYRVISDTPLLSISDEVRGKLTILYENVPIEDVHLLSIRIVNDGNTPIASSDFEQPMSLYFGKNAKILSAGCIDTYPGTLKPTFTSDDNRLTIQPLLFNSRDAITMKVILTKFTGTLEIEARIIGVREIRRTSDIRPRLTRRVIFPLVFAIGSIGLSLQVFITPTGQPIVNTFVGFLGLIAAGIFTNLASSALKDFEAEEMTERTRNK